MSGDIAIRFGQTLFPEGGVAGATDDKMVVKRNAKESARGGKKLGELNIGR